MMIFLSLRVTADAEGGLKKPGALAPGFTGVWGRSATNKRASVYTEALLAATAICPVFR